MTTKTKLELTWPGKHKRPRLEPRILLEDKALSHHAAARTAPDLVEQAAGTAPTAFDDNLLIQGDNLLALKALEGKYAGKIKCVFIDPPYNTGSAFTHYDDGVEHSMWLTLIRDRLEIIRTLLAEDGSLWITIDDNEAHYLKVMCDEIFGRENFVANVIWEKADSPRNSARQFSTDHDHLFVFSKRPNWTPIKLERTEEANSIYTNPDNDPRGAWLPGDPYANKPYSKGQYSIQGPTGRTFSPPPGRFWRISEEKLRELDLDNRVWWGPTGAARPSIKRYLSEVGNLVPRTIWSKDDVGSNRTSKNEMRLLFPGDSSFDTPKPERLIERVVNIATKPGDLVLDSFAGSGTTGAVAHKMGRRWIMVELGEHCHTHVVPRLKKVIDGDDPGGITKAVGWQGGGGFRYYRLAPSLLKKDKWGHWVINPEYNGEMLSEAMCKLMGFTYAPSQSTFWQHGRSTETDFIYVTTGSLSHDQLRVISEEVGNERSLLICCKAFMADITAFPNLTLKKIPKTVLHKCEWDHDDYSFSIDVLAEPEALPEEDDEFELNAGTEDAADE
jgi:adenine-specific DNA-methyltransferase